MITTILNYYRKCNLSQICLRINVVIHSTRIGSDESVVAKPRKFSHRLIFRKPQTRIGVIDKRCSSHVPFHRLKCRGKLGQDAFSRDSGSPSRVLSRTT